MNLNKSDVVCKNRAEDIKADKQSRNVDIASVNVFVRLSLHIHATSWYQKCSSEYQKKSSKYKSKRHKIHIIICCIISYLEKKMRIALLMI